MPKVIALVPNPKLNERRVWRALSKPVFSVIEYYRPHLDTSLFVIRTTDNEQHALVMRILMPDPSVSMIVIHYPSK